MQEQIQTLEWVVREQVKMRPAFRYLKTVDGIEEILALTIILETGDIQKFAEVGHSDAIIIRNAPCLEPE
ncbi:MAG: hypothetical protein ACE5JU_24420 [Candidatus Binatia bacterium]